MKRKKDRPTQSGPQDSECGITRRDLIKGAVGLGAMTALSSCAYVEKDSGGVTRKSVAGQKDLIRRENEESGTRDWLLTNTRVDPKTKYRCPWIEGYCSRTSVRAGESISFHVSTNPASTFSINLYRMGYYGGAGARHVMSLGTFAGAAQPDPEIGPNRLRECKWD